jgi:uncharacterized protein (TIRG00374 family)
LRVRVRWSTVVVLALTVGLLWLFLKDIDPTEMWQAMAHAHPGLILAAIAATMLTYVVRAIRWRVLLQPVGPTRFRTALRTTIIGFALLFLLPARIGEVVRPYLLARHEGLNATSTFATVVVERLLDVVAVLLLFALAIPLAGVPVGPEVQAAGLFAGVSAGVALVALFVLAGHPERLARWVSALSRWLPARIGTTLAHLARTFAEGLSVMRNPGHLGVAMLWSLPLWGFIALDIWLTTLAFDLTMPVIGAFLVMGYLTVGVSVPTPGGTGSFHYFYQLAMTTLFGADATVAAAAAIVLHAVSFVPVTIVGLVYMWQDGLTLAGLRGMRSAAVQSGEGGVA